MLGASFDAPSKNRAFAEKFCYPYKLLTFDKDREGAAYDASDPSDPDWPGRLSYLIGPDRRVVAVWSIVNPATHAADVLAEVP